MLEKEYETLFQLFGVDSWAWDQIHRNYSPSMFCKDNRASLIAEYLIWQDFVKRAKEANFVYYCGIDDFLREYKDAVESRVNLD